MKDEVGEGAKWWKGEWRRRYVTEAGTQAQS